MLVSEEKFISFHYSPLFSIPNLETNKAGPVVAVRGRSILPFCHFELEESDYLTSGRRRMDLLINNGSTQAPSAFVDRQTRVIEFKAIGIGSTINRSVPSQQLRDFFSSLIFSLSSVLSRF